MMQCVSMWRCWLDRDREHFTAIRSQARESEFHEVSGPGQTQCRSGTSSAVQQAFCAGTCDYVAVVCVVAQYRCVVHARVTVMLCCCDFGQVIDAHTM